MTRHRLSSLLIALRYGVGCALLFSILLTVLWLKQHRWAASVTGLITALRFWRMQFCGFTLLCSLTFWFAELAETEKRKRKRVVVGTQLLAPQQFNAQIQGTGLYIPCYTTSSFPFVQPRKQHHKLHIRKEDETTHILLNGDSGMGKSALIHSFLLQIRARSTERVILYDPSLEFWAHHAQPGDFLLHPLSKDCPHWNIINEIDSSLVPPALARSLLPEKSEFKKEYWEEKSQSILAFLLNELAVRQGSASTLVEWLSDESRLDQIVAGTQIAQDINPDAVGQRSGILSSLNKVVQFLGLLPDEAQPSFSFKEWYEGDRPSWIFMGCRGYQERSALLPLIAAWIDTALSRALMTVGGPPLWFFVDEVPSLGFIPSLRTGIVEGRKSNVRLVSAIQGYSQFEHIFGKQARTLASSHSTQIQLRAREAQSAVEAANNLGRPLLSSVNRSHSRIPGQMIDRQVNETPIEKVDYLVQPDEVRKLKKLQGYLTYDDYLVPLKFEYPSIHKINTFDEIPQKLSTVTREKPNLKLVSTTESPKKRLKYR